jgi:Protein of unknown function (DUF1524)
LLEARGGMAPYECHAWATLAHLRRGPPPTAVVMSRSMNDLTRGEPRTNVVPISGRASRKALALIVLAIAMVMTGVSACGNATSANSKSLTSQAQPTSTKPPATSASAKAASPSTKPVPSTVPASSPPKTALAALATLPVKGRAPKTGYSRAQFGPAWTDDVTVAAGHNGCDTRNDILRRDLTAVVIKPGSNGCTVLSGVLHDPYTNTTIHFTRDNAGAVQIDHVVSLLDAWQTGAQKLTMSVRTNLANDPLELLAVSGSANEQKADADAASWLPPNKAFRCPFVARQVAVKVQYHLWVTPAEHDAIARVLASCPSQPLPTAAGTAPPSPKRTPVPPATTKPPATTQRTTPPRSTPKPAPTTPRPKAPPTTTKSPSTTGPVLPGAFCAPEGATGKTKNSVPMKCSPDQHDRNRWMRA